MRLGARLCFSLALGLAACSSKEEPVGTATKLVFSAIPDQDETRLREKYAPVAAYLSDALGMPVEYLHSTSYEDTVEHFKNGDVQLAWFGGLSGVQARHAVDDAEAIAMGASDAEFRSYFIAHRDAGVEPAETFPMGLAGKSFTFGSRGSTSGRLMPEHFIRAATGRSPAEFFGMETPNHADSHDATVELVESGRFQAGAVNRAVYDRRVEEGTTDPNVCRVVWTTPPYPDYNFTVHPSLGAERIAALQRAILEMNDENLLSAFLREKFVPCSNRDFEPIEKLARELGFLR
ncbi:MAG: putative selenate ABC transporter substrate-binding protein [Planctomycetota bacterium JB042]